MSRRFVRLLGAAVICAAAIAPGDPDASAAAPARFSLSARADAMGIEVTAAGLPLVPEGKAAFVTPASAQALLESLGSFGDSRAFASAPYPGEFLVSLPTTINGLGAGILPPIPSFPFYVSADAASGGHTEAIGPYEIAADANPTAASAGARIGLQTATPAIGAVTARAEVRVAPDTGVLTADAVATVEPLKVNDLLSIGEVRSHVRLTYDPAQPAAGVKKATSFSVGTVSIAGVELGLTKDGLTVAGQKVLPVDLTGLKALLAPLGLSIEYLPGTETATSITSASLAITYAGNFPTLGATRLRYVLGQVSAGSSTPTPVATEAPPAGVSSGVVAPALGADLALPPTDGFVAPALPAASSSPPAPAVRSSSTRPVPLTDPSIFYVALVGAAIVALGSSRLSTWANRWRPT
jgi:hypothetical protein